MHLARRASASDLPPCRAPAPALAAAAGDVWYCAGQSNMWLPMSYSYHRNFSISNITAGNYDNIRLMAGNSQAGTFHPWMTAKQASKGAVVDKR